MGTRRTGAALAAAPAPRRQRDDLKRRGTNDPMALIRKTAVEREVQEAELQKALKEWYLAPGLQRELRNKENEAVRCLGASCNDKERETMRVRPIAHPVVWRGIQLACALAVVSVPAAAQGTAAPPQTQRAPADSASRVERVTSVEGITEYQLPN